MVRELIDYSFNNAIPGIRRTMKVIHPANPAKTHRAKIQKTAPAVAGSLPLIKLIASTILPTMQIQTPTYNPMKIAARIIKNPKNDFTVFSFWLRQFV